jgi:hypothetical protein
VIFNTVDWVRVVVFNATFNNILVISWWKKTILDVKATSWHDDYNRYAKFNTIVVA